MRNFTYVCNFLKRAFAQLKRLQAWAYQNC